MRAAVFYGINDVRVEERKLEGPLAGGAIVQVKACAVCGTDVRIVKNGHKRITPPCVLGHEIAGVVVETGAGVREVSQGDKVVIVTPVGCGECRFCKAGYQNMCRLVSKETHSIGYYCDGGFAEYISVPAEAVSNNNLMKFNSNGVVSFEELSLVEPFSCVINGQRFLDLKEGENVVIFGCGAIGCMHAYLARLSGVERIFMVDNNPKRVDMAARLDIADVVLNSATHDVKRELSALTGGAGADNVIVACSSVEAQRSAFEVSGIRAKISLFAGVPADKKMLEIDANDVHYLEKSVFGAFASSHRQYREALDLIISKKISLAPLVSEVLGLNDFNSGLNLLREGGVFKVVIRPDTGVKA